jgi:thioredoxin 1
VDEIALTCTEKVKVVKINVDDHPALGVWYDIQFIPTLLCFVNGKVCGRIVGTASKEAILSQLKL